MSTGVVHLSAISFTIALVGSFFNPAQNVVIRLVVEEREIVQAQALSRATQSIALPLAPVLGSILLFFFGLTVGLLLDALSFGISVTALLCIHSVPLPRHASNTSLDERGGSN